MKRLIVAALFASATPALAQMDHSQMDHSAHQMPPAPEASADPHAGHSMPAADDMIPKGVAPPVPTDHAAEAFYDPAVMARARAAMIQESGGMTFSQLMVDRLEYRANKGANGYAWEGEG